MACPPSHHPNTTSTAYSSTTTAVRAGQLFPNFTRCPLYYLPISYNGKKATTAHSSVSHPVTPSDYLMVLAQAVSLPLDAPSPPRHPCCQSHPALESTEHVESGCSTGPEPRSRSEGRRPSLSGGPPPWAPAKEESAVGDGGSTTTATHGVGRRPSLSGGMPRWAPAPTAVTAEAETAGVVEQKEGSESSAKEKGEPATSGVRVSDWLAAVATTGTASGEVRGEGVRGRCSG